MRILFPLLLAVGCGAPAFEPTLAPLTHDVEYQVEDGVARMTVHRAYRGVETPELDLAVPLPTAGAVDRFRFAIDGRWYGGELLDANLAEQRYRVLSGLAGVEGSAVAGAPPPALLAFDEPGRLRLRAYPITPEETVEIEYRVTLPTCHANGRTLFDYPFDPQDPPLFSGPGQIRDRLDTDDFESACDPNATALEGAGVVIELDPLPSLSATYAVQRAGERSVVRVAIDAPPELAPIPAAPTVVFLIDGSYSMGDVALADQLGWARAYLDWVPDASVEVVVFRREAERLFERMVPARDFADAVAALPAERRALGNGSSLDGGLALATSILDSAGGETRVVATSDLLLRDAFDPEAARESLGPAVLHLLRHEVDPELDPSLSLDPGGAWAALPEATGGVFGTLDGDPTADRAIEVAEELVHPIRLDAIELAGLDGVTHDPTLERGRGQHTIALLSHGAPDRIEIRGRLWSTEVSLERGRSREVDDAMPAILVGTVQALTSEELREVAEAGGVVSEETSYLAEMGGRDPLPPPEEVFETFCLGARGFGTSYSCGCNGFGTSYGITGEPLRRQVSAFVDACGARGVEVAIETTRDEIADVSVAADEGAECLTEAIWSLRIDEGYRPARHAHFTFRF